MKGQEILRGSAREAGKLRLHHIEERRLIRDIYSEDNAALVKLALFTRVSKLAPRVRDRAVLL